MTEDGIRYVYGLCCFHDFALCSSNLVPMIGSRDRDDSLIYSEDQRASIVLALPSPALPGQSLWT